MIISTKLCKGIALLLTVVLVSGCSMFASKDESTECQKTEKKQKITRYTGEKSKALSHVYTGRKELALTFNGMGDDKMMRSLLEQLDSYKIKATFFLPGIRVAEEPNIAKDILARGHEIQNNTLNQQDMSKLSYEQIYREIQLSNEVIKRETGISPRYVRTKSGDVTDDVRLAAAHLGMEAVVSYNINPKDRDLQRDAKTIGDYIARYMSRGSIISLNTDINPEVSTS
ncbi:polysaccharide deacetylase family protein, partial [Brevibacillus sp. BC25]|uniref:polysaccharide deacetylase family protein n=1 Tax=Brevibacillus sp. BC25 TaxID=1144308 RepID=UPI000270FBD3|nr:putative xylanase/chitin deacetylase [Brevibacillus sp. BC25]